MNSRPPLEWHREDLERVLRVLAETPAIDREYMAPREEFQGRVRRLNEALQRVFASLSASSVLGAFVAQNQLCPALPL